MYHVLRLDTLLISMGGWAGGVIPQLASLFKARTLCTSTKALTAQFEHTILITDLGHEAGRNVLEKGAFWCEGILECNNKCSVYIGTYIYRIVYMYILYLFV